jgi:hypothetical protein
MSSWPSRGRSRRSRSTIVQLRYLGKQEKGSQFPEGEWGTHLVKIWNGEKVGGSALYLVVRCRRPMEGATRRCRGSVWKSLGEEDRDVCTAGMPRTDVCRTALPRRRKAAHGRLRHRNATHRHLRRLCRRDALPPPPPGRRAAFYGCRYNCCVLAAASFLEHGTRGFGSSEAGAVTGGREERAMDASVAQGRPSWASCWAAVPRTRARGREGRVGCRAGRRFHLPRTRVQGRGLARGRGDGATVTITFGFF